MEHVIDLRELFPGRNPAKGAICADGSVDVFLGYFGVTDTALKLNPDHLLDTLEKIRRAQNK